MIAKSIVSFYQNNSKLPGLFDEQNEEETMQNLVILADKAGMKFDERKARDMIRTSSYCFYPLVHMFAAIVSLEVVKCTGKYRPVKSPFMVDWYGKIGFESKKKVEGTIVNIIDTHTLQKLSQLQYYSSYTG